MQNLMKIISGLFFFFFFSVNNLLALDCEYFKNFINYVEKNHYNGLENKVENLTLGFKLLVNKVDEYRLFFSPQQVKTWTDSILNEDSPDILNQSCVVVEELIEALPDVEEKTRTQFKKLVDRFSSGKDVASYYKLLSKRFEKVGDIEENWVLFKEYIMLGGWNALLEKIDSEKLSYEELKTQSEIVFNELFCKNTHHVPGWFFDSYLKDFLLLIDPHTGFIVEYNSKDSSENNSSNTTSVIDQQDPMEVTGVIHSGVDALSGKKYNVGVLRIKHFTYSKNEKDRTSFKVREALSVLNDSVDSLVVDLRDNSGGDKIEVLQIINYFLKTPTTVMLQKTHWDKDVELVGTLEEDLGEKVYNGLFNKPMVVLINDKTISSAEVFAASMQDLGRAIIVGGLSFGKGVGQQYIDLSFDKIEFKQNFNSQEEEKEYRKKYSFDVKKAVLVVTAFKTFRLSGKSIQNFGVSPDIEIPMSNFQNSDREEDARVKFENETVDPLDPSKYTRYSIVDDNISDVRTRFDIRKKDNDSNLVSLSRFVNFDKISGMYFWKESDEEKIADTILKVAVSIASDYVDTTCNKDK